MQPRDPHDITQMLAEARRKLDESKAGVQPFGGDALNLRQFEHTFNLPGGVNNDYCFRVVMTPDLPEFTMPIDTITKPAAPGQFGYMKVERVPTTDGTFEWLVFTTQYDFDPATSTLFRVTYSGQASFNVTQLG